MTPIWLRKVAQKLTSPPARSRSRRDRGPRPSTPCVERLEDRTLPATITWINAAGGSWHTGSNWDLNRVPTTSDDVRIFDVGTAGANVTVTYSSGTISVRSLLAQEHLTLSGGTLTVNGPADAIDPGITGNLLVAAGASFQLQSTATLSSAHLASDTVLLGEGGTLSGAALAAGSTIRIVGSQAAIVVGGLTLNGTVEFPDSTGALLFDGTQMLGGSGTVRFFSTGAGGGANAVLQLTQEGTTLTTA